MMPEAKYFFLKISWVTCTNVCMYELNKNFIITLFHCENGKKNREEKNRATAADLKIQPNNVRYGT